MSIGNLTVGGTGKTPAVELAVRTLTQLGHRPAVLSRGYGRSGGGVQVVADAASIRLDADEAGDEPFLLARRLPGVPVVVGANRYEAGRVARARFGVTVVVLDDGEIGHGMTGFTTAVVCTVAAGAIRAAVT